MERETLIAYLDSIVERLLKILKSAAMDVSKQPKNYVQEQVITTRTMVTDTSDLDDPDGLVVDSGRDDLPTGVEHIELDALGIMPMLHQLRLC